MTKYNLSEKEQEKYLLERMACEAKKPETEEQKKLAEDRIKKLNALAREERKRQGLDY